MFKVQFHLITAFVVSVLHCACLAQDSIKATPREIVFDYEDFSPIQSRLDSVQSQVGNKQPDHLKTGTVQNASYEFESESENSETISPSPTLRLKPRISSTESETPVTENPVESSTIRMISSLAIVLATFFFVAWLFRKNQERNSHESLLFSVLASQSIDRQHHVHLVKLSDRLLVVGTTGSNMQCLSEICDEDQVVSIVEQLTEQDSKPSRFSKKQTETFSEMLDGFQSPSRIQSQ